VNGVGQRVVGAAWLDEPSHYGDELTDMATTRLRGVDRLKNSGMGPAGSILQIPAR
jgi:hypothetical protein